MRAFLRHTRCQISRLVLHLMCRLQAAVHNGFHSSQCGLVLPQVSYTRDVLSTSGWSDWSSPLFGNLGKPEQVCKWEYGPGNVTRYNKVREKSRPIDMGRAGLRLWRPWRTEKK